MAEFFTLTCPSCGSKLKITNEVNRFACAHCGNEHIVKRGEGVVSLEPVVEGLVRIEKGVDRTASELAIRRLREEIYALECKVSQIKSRIKSLENPSAVVKPAPELAVRVYISLKKYGKAEVFMGGFSEVIDQLSIEELEAMYAYFGGNSGSVHRKGPFGSRFKAVWADLHEMLSPIPNLRNQIVEKKEQIARYLYVVNH